MPQIKSSFILQSPNHLDVRSSYENLAAARTAASEGIIPSGQISWIESESKHYKYDGTTWSPFQFDDMQYLTKAEMREFGSGSAISPGQLAYCREDGQVYYWAYDGGNQNVSSSAETGWYLPLVNIANNVYLTLEEARSNYLTRETAAETYQEKGDYAKSSDLNGLLSEDVANGKYVSYTQGDSRYMSKSSGLTKNDAESLYVKKDSMGSYLTKEEAVDEYLSKTSAASTYMSKDDGLSKSEAGATYLSKTEANNTYSTIGVVSDLNSKVGVIEKTLQDQEDINSGVSDTLSGINDTLGEITGSISGISSELSGVKDDVTTLKETVKNGTHWAGVVEIVNGEVEQDAPIEEYKTGDIIIYGNAEYILGESGWVLLGDTTAEAQRITEVETEVETLKTQTSTHTSNIEDLTDRVEVLEGGYKIVVESKEDYEQRVQMELIDEKTIYFTFE